MRNNLPLGKYGEELAVKYLKSKGYKTIEQNFRSRVGEIDIIALSGSTLVFVEVKTRSSEKYGPPEEAIGPWKIKSITRTAQFYKMLHPKLPDSLRIDAVLVELSPTGVVKRLEHLENISG
ncbi:MAG: YraN family protein [bacterium]|nr:YraN family protein [bacterium]